MKKIIVSILAVAAVVAALVVSPGCVTSKVPVVSGGTTNFVTIVNTNNLMLDTALLQGATAIGVSIAVQKDPSLVQPFKDAQVALDGVLNGSNTNTTTQVLQLLGQNGNPVVAAQITPLINVISGLEQQLLAKYGVTVAGQIGTAVAKAVDAGFIIGLQGH